MARSSSPTRRRHARAAPSGFMAFYTENYKKFSNEYLEKHKTQASVTLISKIAATAYGQLTDEEKLKYKNPDIKFFTVEKSSNDKGADKSEEKTEEKTPRDGKQKSPKKEENLPKKEENLPKKEENLPKEDEKSPKKEENLPKKEENLPKEEENLPREDEKVPEEEENLPKEDEKIPEEDGKSQSDAVENKSVAVEEQLENDNVKSVKVDDITDDLEGFTFL